MRYATIFLKMPSPRVLITDGDPVYRGEIRELVDKAPKFEYFIPAFSHALRMAKEKSAEINGSVRVDWVTNGEKRHKVIRAEKT